MARALAAEMADGTSPVATAIARRMLWQMLAQGDPVRAHEAESEALHFLGPRPDVHEGVASFLEKRPAAFPLAVSRDMPPFFERWQAERGGLGPPSGNRGRSYDRLRTIR